MKEEKILFLMRRDIFLAAERKLERKLGKEEREVIEQIRSLMMLEAIARSFDAPTTTAIQIQEELRQLASRH